MPPSDRFKPIQKLNAQRERTAASALGESLKKRNAATHRLEELNTWLAEYRDRFAADARKGLSSAQVREYQVFIGKLESAIAQQQKVVADTQRHCDTKKEQWRSRYSKSKSMDNAVERMRVEERKAVDRGEQAESDDRGQRKR